MKLAKRTPRFDEKRKDFIPAMRAFHQPQRDHVKGPVPPKPFCLMCGGKVRTRVDYRAPDGTWLCKSCDTGAEVGMPRAA